jgi:hypothetical protein
VTGSDSNTGSNGAALMTTIAGLGSFLAGQADAAGPASAPAAAAPIPIGTLSGASKTS